MNLNFDIALWNSKLTWKTLSEDIAVSKCFVFMECLQETKQLVSPCLKGDFVSQWKCRHCSIHLGKYAHILLVVNILLVFPDRIGRLKCFHHFHFTAKTLLFTTGVQTTAEFYSIIRDVWSKKREKVWILPVIENSLNKASHPYLLLKGENAFVEVRIHGQNSRLQIKYFIICFCQPKWSYIRNINEIHLICFLPCSMIVPDWYVHKWPLHLLQSCTLSWIIKSITAYHL